MSSRRLEREKLSEVLSTASQHSFYGCYPRGTGLLGGESLKADQRLNASGSKKVRTLLNEDDWDGLLARAKFQVKEGAHMLDVKQTVRVARDGTEYFSPQKIHCAQCSTLLK
ncbi:MAG: hypothetical protein QNJ51_24460 [Calothrix sp. MO_167.B12]|nr:hypothetical protein [Calothrix sp. MO_167.B12]